MTTKREETKALTLAQRFPIMALSDDLAEIIETNLGGERLSPFDLDRIRVPSGGTRAWDVGEQPVAEIEGIILHTHMIRSYWSESMEEGGGGNPPDCSSPDGIHGVGSPGGDCATCPMASWESGRPECKEMRVIFLAREGEPLPSMLLVPPSSLTPVRNYMRRTLLKEMAPVNGVITAFGLEKVKSAGNVDYSRIVPRMVYKLTPTEREEVKGRIAMLAPLFSQDVAAIVTDPEYEGGDLATRTGHAPWKPTECANGQHSEFGYYDQNGALHCDRCKAIIEEPAAEQSPLV